jgi:hypothetical protein
MLLSIESYKQVLIKKDYDQGIKKKKEAEEFAVFFFFYSINFN